MRDSGAAAVVLAALAGIGLATLLRSPTRQPALAAQPAAWPGWQGPWPTTPWPTTQWPDPAAAGPFTTGITIPAQTGMADNGSAYIWPPVPLRA